MKMWTKIILIIIGFVGINHSAFPQQKISEIEQSDIRSYSPVNYGLKDLVFEIRISNLKELLEEQYNLKNLIDVYYKVYWIFPGQYKIEVEGVPKGFVDLNYELREMIKDKLEFVIPMPIAAKIRGYELSYKDKSASVVVQGVDRSQLSNVSRIELELEPSGKLKSLSSFSPVGVSKSLFDYNIKPWSHNKWVISKYETVVPNLNGEVRIVHDVSYLSQSGLGLPEEIDVKTIQTFKVQVSADKFETKKNEMGSIISFSKYEINTGKAQRYITQGVQR